MTPKIEILITGQTTSGILDLLGDEQINLVYSIADIKDITKRKGVFSQSFSLSGTKNNSKIFNSIFEINIDSSFNSKKKAACQIIVDSLPITEGNLQLKDINIDKQNNVIYNVVFYGKQDEFYGQIGDAYLTDLDWSELNHTFTLDNIYSSWTGSTIGNSRAYYYPLIDLGYDWDYNALNKLKGMSGVSTTQLVPATNVKYIIDKIFSGAGYNYSSKLINSNNFKNLYCPFNGNPDFLLGTNFGKDRQFKSSPNANINLIMSAFTSFSPNSPTPHARGVTAYYSSIFPGQNDSTNGNFDNGGFWDNTTYKYTANTISVQRFGLNLNYKWVGISPDPINVSQGSYFGSKVSALFYRSGYLNGNTEFFRVDNAITTYGVDNKTLVSPWLEVPYEDKLTFAKSGETFWVNYKIEIAFGLASQSGQTAFIIYSGTSNVFNEVQSKINTGALLDYNNIIPKKLKQVDFLKSFFLMYNCFVDINKNQSKTLIIEPRDVYFTGGTTLDWTNKLDISQKINVQLTSELQSKQTIFSYKKDNDFFNSNYTEKLNRIYGDYYFSNDNEWLENTSEKKIELIFSPTPLTNVINQSGIIIPKIGKVDSNKNFGRSDFNLRILQKNNNSLLTLITSGSTWKLNEFVGGQITNSKSLNGYPYLGHLDHPLTGTTDLNFGQIEYCYYDNDYGITDGNLITLYWKKYLDEISDKNSKIISAYFHLTPNDIATFNFANSIYIEGLTTDGAAYFTVNKIDYSPTNNLPSKVELIKLTNKFVQRTDIPTYIPPLWNRGPIGGILIGESTYVDSPGAVAVGGFSTIGPASSGSILIGDANYIYADSPTSAIFGSSSTIQGERNIIMGGSYNTIGDVPASTSF